MQLSPRTILYKSGCLDRLSPIAMLIASNSAVDVSLLAEFMEHFLRFVEL